MRQRPGSGAHARGPRSTPARARGCPPGIAPPSTTQLARPVRTMTSTSGSWLSGEHARGPPSRRLAAGRVDSSGSTSSAASASQIGSAGSVISSARSSSRTVVAGARAADELRRPSQPPHRLGVAVLGPEDDVARQPLDGYAGAPQHSTRLAVQALAHRCGEILVHGIAYEVVAERETITRLGEQPGIHRRCERGNQLRRISPGEQRQLGQRERRAQDRGDPQQVQGVLGEQAQAAQECQAQGGWQRRRAGLGPPVQHVDRPLVVQRPYELDHEQRVPPGTAHLLEQPRAGREHRPPRRRGEPPPPELNGPRSTCSAPRARRSAMARSTSTPWDPPRTVAEQRQRHTSQVTGDRSAAHAGSTDRPTAGPPRRERPGPSRRTPPRHPRRPPRSTTPRRRRPRRAPTSSGPAVGVHAGGPARRARDRARPAPPPAPRARPAADDPARPRRTHPTRPGNPDAGPTPASRRSDGTCRSPPRPQQARSAPARRRHPRRPRAERPARPPDRPTGPQNQRRPLACCEHCWHTARIQATTSGRAGPLKPRSPAARPSSTLRHGEPSGGRE